MSKSDTHCGKGQAGRDPGAGSAMRSALSLRDVTHTRHRVRLRPVRPDVTPAPATGLPLSVLGIAIAQAAALEIPLSALREFRGHRDMGRRRGNHRARGRALLLDKSKRKVEAAQLHSLLRAKGPSTSAGSDVVAEKPAQMGAGTFGTDYGKDAQEWARAVLDFFDLGQTAPAS